MKVAPEGKFAADSDIAPATPGFDALTVKVSNEPTVALSGPGTARKPETMEALATLKVSWTTTAMPDASTTESLTV